MTPRPLTTTDLAYMGQDLREELREALEQRRSTLGKLEPEHRLLETRLNNHDQLVQTNLQHAQQLTAHLPQDEAQHLLDLYNPGHDNYLHKIRACLKLREAQDA